MITRDTVLLKVKKQPHFEGDLPAYKSVGASGFDVKACLKETLTLKPGDRMLVPTGLSFEVPSGFELQARPRSGLALKKGLTLLNTPGTIDSDYRGEVKILLINIGESDVLIENQDRIAQLVLCPVLIARLQFVDSLDETKRGEGGFGSTGK